MFKESSPAEGIKFGYSFKCSIISSHVLLFYTDFPGGNSDVVARYVSSAHIACFRIAKSPVLNSTVIGSFHCLENW